jgi:hypothetical protein
MSGIARLVNRAMVLVGRFSYVYVVSKKARSFSRIILASR